MKWFGKVPRDKSGRPVEFIKGRPLTNFIRMLIHMDRRMTRQEGWINLGEVRSFQVGGTNIQRYQLGSGALYMRTASGTAPTT